MKNKKIKHGGIIILTIITASFLIAVIFDFSVRINRLLISNIYHSLEQIATLNGKWFVSQIEHEKNIIKIAAESISKSDQYYFGNKENTVSFLKSVCENSNFQRVIFSDRDGKQITNLGETSNASDREYFQTAMNGDATISNPFVSRFATERCITINYPVIVKEEIVGAVHGAYYIDTSKALFIDSEYSEDTYGYITQINGNIIFRSEHSDTLNDSQNLLSFFDFVEFDDGYNVGKLRDALAKGDSGTFGYSLDKNHRYISFTPIGINDWYSFTVSSGKQSAEALNSIGIIVVEAAFKLILFAIIIASIILAYKIKNEKVINKLNKDLMAEIERAYFDPVTEHDNYFRFRMKAMQLFESYPNKKYVIIYSNIKNFKFINDAFGFEVGNAVLRRSINWLNENNSLLYARVSADSFVSIKEYESEEIVRLESSTYPALEFDVTGIAEGLSTVIVHAGVYCAPSNCELSLESMIDRARLALNKARVTMPSGSLLYDESMRFNMLETQRIENKMRASLNGKEFKVYMQPKINICENKIVACEALARWDDPERGLVSPAVFIPVFERNGFIKELDMYMFRQVCTIMQKWIEEGIKVVPVSVNVSKTLLYSPTFIQDYLEIKKEFDIPQGYIEVEFTESVITENKVRINEVLAAFKDNGIKCAIDDFGAGYSSLNMLKDLPADVLKIDKAFFDKSEYNDREKSIIKNVISMANDLSMQIVAEGVELKEQVDFLRSVDCFIVQGYVFDRPMSVENFEKKYLR